MRAHLFIGILIISIHSCVWNEKSNRPKNHETISSQKNSDSLLDNVSFTKTILVSSAQFFPYKTIIYEQCNFDLVEDNNDTIYISTRDERFRTPEGFYVGMKFSDLPKRIRKSLIKEDGWAYYCKIPSGWNLGFCQGGSCTGNYPKGNSLVAWIFKRKY